MKGELTVLEPTRAERLLARRSAEARAIVPSVELSCQVEVDNCLAMSGQRGTRPLSAVLSILARELQEFPRLNGAYRDGRFELYSRINLGLTLAGPGEPLIGTLFDVAERNLDEVDAELDDLTRRARAGELSAAELTGSTFTVTPPGPAGVALLTPLVQPPQAGALAMGAWVPSPVARGGALTVAQVSLLTLACDHRIVPPQLAADFLSGLKRSLEAPEL